MIRSDVIPQAAAEGEAFFQCAQEAFDSRCIPTALEMFRRAELAGCDPDQCASHRWSCWMLLGQFEEAWKESDRITLRGTPDPFRFWDGRSFRGNRVLIRCLHGFGDAIQFIRYARLLRGAGARVIVQTHPELVSLLRGMPFAERVITWPDPEGSPAWSQQIEVMELPHAFRTTLATVPAESPYLFVDEGYVRRCRIPPGEGGKLRVGLQWGSGEWKAGRSVSLAELLPLLQFEGCDYYSFQRGAPRRELWELELDSRLRDVSGDSPEIVEAAADLTRIDLLITVDTMLAHLAGALGKQVWVLLPWDADWRWMLERTDSPWYPTMRLFRQRSPGNWRSAVRSLTGELSRLLYNAGASVPLS